LLDAIRAPFRAAGLHAPWLAVHGNHDRLLQGTVPGTGALAAAAVGANKAINLPAHWPTDAIAELLNGLASCDPVAIEALGAAGFRTVTADAARRITTRAEFVAAHFGPAARPPGHGFGPDGRPYYRHDRGRITLLVLDTVDEHGGWQGSLDRDQFDWLESELSSADAERRYVILASHHPLATLVNDIRPVGAPGRVLSTELAANLATHPSVVLWLNGHTHRTTVTSHGAWWEVTAPSLIDWPQQGRIVEVLRSPGTLTIAATMLDHVGTAPWNGSIDTTSALAGLARELAANDWQGRDCALDRHPRSGRPTDRNVLLHLADPWV
jgi:metallophosphoesterase (TIGR03767 family)